MREHKPVPKDKRLVALRELFHILSDVLARANWVKRALFLADRVALVRQAPNAFKSTLPDSAPVNLLTDKDVDSRVYLSTQPSMMGLINETDSGTRRFGPGYFALVVIDEAHRSVYQKYRHIFEHFDSLLLGLTAIPKTRSTATPTTGVGSVFETAQARAVIDAIEQLNASADAS